MWATSPAHTATNHVRGLEWKGLDMSKVVIEPGEHGYRLLVDGVNISDVVKEDSVRVYWDKGRPQVDLTLMPHELRADLPDAVVTAVEALR